MESVHLVKAMSKLKEETNSDPAVGLDSSEREGVEPSPTERIGVMYDYLISEVRLSFFKTAGVNMDFC